MSSGRLRNLRRQKQSDEDNSSLCVIGYACQIYPCSETSDFIAEERHLQVWNGDGNPRIDRFDCRLLLNDFVELFSKTHEDACPTEQMEEEMCEEERYKDMFATIDRQAQEEEDRKNRKAEVSFNYGTSSYVTTATEETGSDSEDEAYNPPLGIKLPVGLITPENLKQSHIIEKTAVFVVEKGPQMEIVIKAKQRNNSEQFGFLEFDNLLNPYYKYICKLIREKKYTPAIIQKKEPVTSEDKSRPGPSCDRTSQAKNQLGALAAIADDHASSDDSDSDCELHPSLFAARKRTPSPDIIEKNNAAGPKQKPERVEQVAHKAEYNMHQSNDMYASLFKSISQVSTQQEKEKKKDSERRIIEKRMMDIKEDPDWRSWWESFYGIPCPYNGPLPMVPPPPDMEKAVYSYASLVAQHGPDAESSIIERCDPNLDFMLIESPYYSYYLHRVRHSQWEIACRHRGVDLPPINPPREVYVDANLSPRPSSSPGSPMSMTADAAPLNRKQRRRLQDAVRYEGPLPGMIDSTASKIAEPGLVDIPKTHSSPALMVTMLPESKPSLPLISAPSAPVSFSLTPREDVKLPHVSSCSSFIFDDPIDQVTGEQLSSGEPAEDISLPQELQPPAPPQMLSNSQIDRKEKARLFMEKLLNEKRKKAYEEEEIRIRELESQRAELEMQLRAAETVSITEYKDHSPTSSPKKDEAPKSLDVIDKMLSKRITNLLGKSEETVKDTESDEERSVKKEKKKKSKHRTDRKRSRSTSKSRDRRSHSRSKKTRRSRSRSRDRRSRSPSYSRYKRKRRSRSSSRDRRRR